MEIRSQETSAVVRDLIHTSELISKGPPSRYRLLTTRSNLYEDGSVRKWTFGQRCVNMENKILLMVGETGTGKTTLINAMINYILGVKFTDEVWFEITEEGGDHHMSDQTKSQTIKITVYEVFSKHNPISLTIIDTPGYGDTRGTTYDKQIADNLTKLFRNETGVKEIDAVCLVVKASENRLTDRQQYIFDAVLSLFGKDIENNIVIFITHSDGLPPKDALNAIMNAAIPCRKNERNEPEHFLFNNRQTEERRPEYKRALQAAWATTEDSFKYFFASLKEQNRKSLAQTENVLTESKRLGACISNLQNRIEFVECKVNELTQIQEALKKNQEKIKRNGNFAFTVIKYYKTYVSLSPNVSWKNRMVTSCTVCKENCHEYNCWLTPNALWCEVIRREYCTSCTGKCHFSKHVRENKKYVINKKKTTMTYNDLYTKFKRNPQSDFMFDSETFENVKQNLQCEKKQEEEKLRIERRLNEELIKTVKEKTDLLEEAYTSIVGLSKIALKTDSAFIVRSLDFLIPRAEESGKLSCAQKLRELREIPSESQERVNAAMAYARAGLSKLFPGI